MKNTLSIAIAALAITLSVVYAASNAEERPALPVSAVPKIQACVPAVPVVEKYTESDLETLAIIIYQEAGSDSIPDEIREYVGCVVLNRVESDQFPNTIQDVATQKRQWGRLHWTGVKWPDRASNPGEAHAVERARATAKKLLESDTRPMPTNVVWCAEFPQGTGTWLHSNGIYFCY